jgi:hypothetical protein
MIRSLSIEWEMVRRDPSRKYHESWISFPHECQRMSRICPPCSACDMHAVAATHSFVLQAEGADCPFNDALDKGKHTPQKSLLSMERRGGPCSEKMRLTRFQF